ncbi:MAG: hypothetical protein ACYC1Q_10400 [Bacteroidia bacterium]
MKIIYSILLSFLQCSPGYAQFDSSGYRFLCYYDSENTKVTTKFTDTNFYLLKNTGKAKEGLILESYNLTNPGKFALRFHFEPSFKQRAISQIQIEQFAYSNGKLALLSNQGIYIAESFQDPIKLVSADLTAFEYDAIDWFDSVLFVYRYSHKTFGPFLEIVSLNIKSGIISTIARENEVAASIYSNFHDTRLIDCNSGVPFRTDYVLPQVYRYGTTTDTLSLFSDSLFAEKNHGHIMPDKQIDFMATYASEADIGHLDTTISLNYSYFANRNMRINREGTTMLLLSSYPGEKAGFNPRFILTDWVISDSSLILEKLKTVSQTSKGDSTIMHALEVISLWGTIHLTEDDVAYYFVIQRATPLSPAGKTATEYYKANYSLQFKNTGFAVIRLEKGNR